jgi:cysteinyl-tRNA synthetase
MGLQIYNTLNGKKEDFYPIDAGKVRMYVCGVTVYDYCHIGHARSIIVFDVIYRHLLRKGYEVTFVRNFTDIDDKIIRRANESNLDYRAIADRFIAAFHEDVDALGALRPTMEPLATDHIAEMIDIIGKLTAKGIAYQSGTDVYFQVERFEGYGKLAGRTLEEMVAGARVEVDANKRNPLDFVLWKGSKPGEPAWESPWGPGRPGWHIECSAMGMRYLGATFDIHGGGKDLIFPHHENELAQSEAAFGVPFARYWLHNGFVNINNEKMSKSLGNFLTIREILEKFHPEALRLFVLSKHYRSPVDFSDETLVEAERGLDRLYGTIAAVKSLARKGAEAKVPEKALEALDSELYAKILSFPQAFEDAMDNDFNTARGIGHLFDLQRTLQRFMDGAGRKQLKGAAAVLAERGATLLCGHAAVLGLLGRDPDVFFMEERGSRLRAIGMTEGEVEGLIEKRRAARQEKNFAESDRIRDVLAKRGVQLEDSPEGTRWRVTL